MTFEECWKKFRWYHSRDKAIAKAFWEAAEKQYTEGLLALHEENRNLRNLREKYPERNLYACGSFPCICGKCNEDLGLV